MAKNMRLTSPLESSRQFPIPAVTLRRATPRSVDEGTDCVHRTALVSLRGVVKMLDGLPLGGRRIKTTAV